MVVVHLRHIHTSIVNKLRAIATGDRVGSIETIYKHVVAAVQQVFIIQLGGAARHFAGVVATLAATGNNQHGGKDNEQDRIAVFHSVHIICALILFLAYKHVDGATVHRPVFTNFVFKEAAIGLLDILRQVCVEHKRRYLCVRQLRAIFNLNILTLG